jgi:hypothetical protein
MSGTATISIEFSSGLKFQMRQPHEKDPHYRSIIYMKHTHVN